MDFKNGISLCMIVKNEEKFLTNCLNSIINYVDEICIVDTGSTDNTLSIINDFIKNSFKVKLKQIKWNNHFGNARNVSLEMATYSYILILDVDEVIINPELLNNQFKHLGLNKTGLVFFDNLTINNKQINYEHWNNRMFHNGFGIKFHGRIHEYLVIDENILDSVFTSIKINHYGYDIDIIVNKNKLKRNMDLLLQYTLEEPLNAFNWFNLGLAQIYDTSSEEKTLLNLNPFYDLKKSIYSFEMAKKIQLESNNKGTYYEQMEKYLNKAKGLVFLIDNKTNYETTQNIDK